MRHNDYKSPSGDGAAIASAQNHHRIQLTNSWLGTKFKICHGISDNIKDIKSQVKKVKEQYDRYNVHRVVANLVATTVDPRLLAMYNKVSDLVGIDEGAKELMNNLFEDGDKPVKKIKTVSVVRFGGLGKTTLVKAVYDKVKKDFDCSAFVSIGQKCDLNKVFKDVLYDLDKQNHENIIASKMDENNSLISYGNSLQTRGMDYRDGENSFLEVVVAINSTQGPLEIKDFLDVGI
ncbi:NB-ARC domain containing protein expressed [Zea mays]|uniref:NB-ARC domain containing protein expressed n=1 Tax=Zea mays TaxID=4577 RepID=A0A1D6IYD7_MAIZE|nr:NB-ARC domain containing protein expressed [Zea mays]